MVALRRGLLAGSLAIVAGLALGVRLLLAQAPGFSDSPYALPPSATSSDGSLAPLPPYVPPASSAPSSYGGAPSSYGGPTPSYGAPAPSYDSAPPGGVPTVASRTPAVAPSFNTPTGSPAAGPALIPAANQVVAPAAPARNPNFPSYTAPAMELPEPASGAYAAPSGAQKGETIVREVRVEGNHTTPLAKMPKLSTRVDQPFDPHLVEEDVRALASSRKFLDVKSQFQSVPGGIIVIFQVVERPTLEYVKFVGNQDVRTQTLRKKSELEKGQPLDPYAVEEARRRVEAYYHEKGYNHIQITTVEGDKPNDRGAVFMVDEGQSERVLWVSFDGNTIASGPRLRTQIAIKPGVLWLFGGKVDRKKIDDDVQKLYAYYRGLGFFKAKISPDLDYNEDKNWLTLTYVIEEGPRFSIRNVSFNGNEKFKAGELSKGLEQISGKPFNQATLDHDLIAIRDVYGTHGYVFSDVQAETRLLEDKPEMDLIYNVSEGKRYRVGKINVNIAGDDPHTKHATIYDRLSLHPGDIVDTKKIREDERRLRASALFNVDPSKGGAPKIAFNKQDTNPDAPESSVAERPTNGSSVRPGSGNRFGSPFGGGAGAGGVGNGPAGYGNGYGGTGPGTSSYGTGGVYDGYRGQSPDDDEVVVDITCPQDAAGNYLKDAAGNYLIVFTPSQESAGRMSDRTVQQARFQSPGSGYGNAAAGPSNSDWSSTNAPSGDAARSAWGIPSGSSTPSYLPPGAQPQSPSTVMTPFATTGPSSYTAGAYPPSTYPPVTSNVQYQQPGATQPAYVPSNNVPPVSAPANTAPPAYVQSTPQPNPYPPGFATSGGNAFGPGYGGGNVAPQPVYSPQGVVTQPAYQPLSGPPQQGILPQPLPPPSGGVGYQVIPPEADPSVDLNVSAAETMTGRLQIGAGINSDAGLVGNFVLDEQNFDITRLPRSWDDISDGTAWRGGGQQFRIEAEPGTELQRYAVTFREPYLFDTPVQFSISAYYFTRIYESWTEGRVGGTTSLGYAFTPDLKGTIGFRGEQVQVYNPIPSNPASQPPQLTAALGDNDLYGFSLGLSHDTRDSPFLPTQGHLISTTFEEVVGSFEYPRVDVQGQQYFLLHQRADGSGRQVIGIGGQLDVTGSDTPIYDTYYAGGFSTLRGFAFRGVTPRGVTTLGNPTGVGIGGDFMLLGTAEYMFPITADDALRGVVFCDFGTVEQDVRLSNFRVAPGFGLRISIPAMGPAPIALDLAFPVASSQGDEIQNFSFFVGIGR
jgi:outer membrane protein insertion porin family